MLAVDRFPQKFQESLKIKFVMLDKSMALQQAEQGALDGLI